MGICASCLGLNRHDSQQGDENDPLLDSTHQALYGAVEAEDLSQPDEEELRREREALDRITAEATESMIDVSHPSTAEHCLQNLPTNHDRYPGTGLKNDSIPDRAEGVDDVEEADGEGEAEWLRSISSSGLDFASEVKGLQSGTLVMDISQLRLEGTSSSTKRALHSALR